MKKKHGIYAALLCVIMGYSSGNGIQPSDSFPTHSLPLHAKRAGQDSILPKKTLVEFLHNNALLDPEESFVEVTITYEPMSTPLTSYENLQLRWGFLFVEELVKAHLKESANENCSYYDVYTTGQKLSSSLISVQFACKERDLQAAMNYFFKEIRDLQKKGFAQEEFEKTKEKHLNDVSFHLQEGSGPRRNDCLSGIREEYESLDAYISFDEFLQLSYNLVKEMTVEDVQGLMAGYFDEEHRQIDYTLSQNITGPGDEDEEEENVSYIQTFIPSFAENCRGFSTLKKGLSNTYSTDLFHQLPLSETDTKLIRKILTTTADKNIFQLLLDKKSMEKKGKKIRHVHPLRFLGFICSDSHLRSCLHSISKNHFKWSSFVEGFEDRMKEENKRGQLLPYVPGFAELLHVDQNTVINYINRSDYEGLMKHFI